MILIIDKIYFTSKENKIITINVKLRANTFNLERLDIYMYVCSFFEFA